jgi:hypothetical protein
MPSESWIINLAALQPADIAPGVFIGFSGPEQLHCGIVYEGAASNGQFCAMHLAWHCLLKVENDISTLQKYALVKSLIQPELLEVLSATCRRISRKPSNQMIPYGIAFSKSYFDEREELVLEPGEHGLTCATFVIAVFRRAGIILLDVEAWTFREEDVDWKNAVIEIQRDHLAQGRFNITQAHVDNLLAENKFSRFRPEEVAASTRVMPMPGEETVVRKLGQEVRSKLA